MRLTLDSMILITIEEKFINIENVKITELINTWMDIIDATSD
jgi:hypothetical protein